MYSPIKLFEAYEKAMESSYRTPDGCLLYKGAHDNHGYPVVSSDGKGGRIRLHRLVSILFLGLHEWEEDQLSLHKCKTKGCFSSEHLYVGSRSDNGRDIVKDGNNYFSNKVRCPQGHEYTQENTFVNIHGGRICRICSIEQKRAYRLRKKLNAQSS